MKKYRKKNGVQRKTLRHNSIQTIPYAVIAAAKTGDPIAMQMVIKHFRPLITSLSMRGDQTSGRYYDPRIGLQLESELMYAIISNF